MNKKELLLSRSYHIPLAMFDEAFRHFQKKYVYLRNIILTVVLLAVGGVYVHAVIKDPSQSLGYLLIVVCAAMILITWYNTFKLRRSLHEALKEIENDIYELKVYPDGMTVLAKDSDGSAFQIAEVRPEEPAPDPEPKTDENGFQQIFPEQEKQPAGVNGEPLVPTEIEFGSNVKITEFAEFFMVYLTYMKNFYIIPKKEFSESELSQLRGLFGCSDKQ